MSGRVLGVLCAVVLSASGAAAQVVVKPTSSAVRSPTRALLVFNHVNAVDIETGQIHKAQRVVVAGTRIRAVGPMDKVGMPRGARVIDARGKYLIPGLWDMHAHNMNSRITANNYASYLVAGVTGVRDMLSPFPRDSFRQWWEEVLAGRRVSPRIILAGYLKSGTHAKPARPRAAIDESSGIVEVGTPQEGRQAVDSFYHAGVDFIKVHDESLPRDIYFAIAAEARQLGIPLAGHLPSQTVSMAEASDSGQRSFEHLAMWTSMPCWETDAAADSACAALAARLRRNDCWLTPTMVLDVFNQTLEFAGAFFADRTRPRGWYAHYRPDATGESTGSTAAVLMPSMWFLSRLHRFGFPLLAGTDAPLPDVNNLGLSMPKKEAATPADLTVVPGLPAPLHGELFLLVEAGLSPLEALQTATLNPAKYFGATDSLGTVAPGKLADLVLLDADPLADIANLATVRAVVANGRYFDRAALDALVVEAKERIVAWVSLERQARQAQEREPQTGRP